MTAIIAGKGALPIHACKRFLLDKRKFFVISLFPKDNLVNLPENIEIIHEPFYKAQAIINLLEKRKVKEVLFIGKVDKQNLLKRFKLDWLAIKLLAGLATKSDFSIMNKIEWELKKRNIKIMSQDTVLNKLLVKPGTLTGKLTPELEKNIIFGIDMARKLSALDIGQTVVIKDMMILALEAIEGTDECIRRGVKLGNSNVIVCKATNANHNTKFDLPTIGPETIKDLKPGDVQAIAWQSDTTLVVDKSAFAKRAKELGIVLYASNHSRPLSDT